MVQGGFNAALQPNDSTDAHLRDTIAGGAYLNNQELAKALTTDAPLRILELEEVLGCRFDRNSDGGFDFKPFAGMSVDRTVHRGDLTGIEIVSRLSDHVMSKAEVQILEEHRALDVLHADDGATVAGGVISWAQAGAPTVGDNVLVLNRALLADGLCSDLGESHADLAEFERRAQQVAILLRSAGVPVLVEI